MKIWYCMIFVFVWVFLLAILGRAIARVLPWRVRPIAKLFLSPSLGLAAYVLIATLVGWIYGEKQAIVVPLTVFITLLSFWIQRADKNLWKYLLLSMAISFSAIGALMPIIFYGGYNVFNDTFTYLVHGQWLQNHSFRTFVHPTVMQPALSQIALYQQQELRMGASFVLAWMQSASPFEWSIQMYPITVAVALVSGAFSIAGLVYGLVPYRKFALGWGVVAGTTVGGFGYGSVMGFLPQMFGLAIVAAAVALLSWSELRSAGRYAIWEMLPLALLMAAVGYAYSELFPLAVISVAGWFMWQFVFGSGRRRDVLASSSLTFLFTACLLNTESIRIFHALVIQSKVLVGWPIPWSFYEFIAHSMGLRSGSGDGDRWLFPRLSLNFVAFCLGLISATATFVFPRGSRRGAAWIAPAIYLGCCLTGALLFRYHSSAPWPTGVGQSWNQFKLSNWSSPILLGVIGAGVLRIAKSNTGGILASSVIALLVTLNLGTHASLTPDRISETLRLSGRSYEPFKTYLDMRAAMGMARPAGPVYIDLTGVDYKSRHILSYFLYDFGVLADWHDDGYIYPHLPREWEHINLDMSRWWIRRGGIPARPDGSMQSGALIFEPTPDFSTTRKDILGGHGVESDDSGWWIWVADRVSIKLQVQGKLPARARLTFQSVGKKGPSPVQIIRRAKGQPPVSEQVDLGEGWRNFSSDPFLVSSQEIEVEIVSQGPFFQIADTDRRMVSFLVKNLRLELVH